MRLILIGDRASILNLSGYPQRVTKGRSNGQESTAVVDGSEEGRTTAVCQRKGLSRARHGTLFLISSNLRTTACRIL